MICGTVKYSPPDAVFGDARCTVHLRLHTIPKVVVNHTENGGNVCWGPRCRCKLSGRHRCTILVCAKDAIFIALRHGSASQGQRILSSHGCFGRRGAHNRLVCPLFVPTFSYPLMECSSIAVMSMQTRHDFLFRGRTKADLTLHTWLYRCCSTRARYIDQHHAGMVGERGDPLLCVPHTASPTSSHLVVDPTFSPAQREYTRGYCADGAATSQSLVCYLRAMHGYPGADPRRGGQFFFFLFRL